MKKMISLILALAMSLVLCVPAFAAEGELPTDSAADVEIVYNAEEAERLESDITRDAKPPRTYHDLSHSNYRFEGTFDTSIYTLCYFKPNASGKINYWFTFEWEHEFEVSPICPGMTVECWDMTTGKLAKEATFESKSTVWPYKPLISRDNQTFSGLNKDHYYYFRFYKDIPFANATIFGTISH